VIHVSEVGREGDLLSFFSNDAFLMTYLVMEHTVKLCRSI